MSLHNKAFTIDEFTVTVTEVTASPAVADFQITDPNSVLSNSFLIKAILSAAIGNYRVDNSLDTELGCQSGTSCGCPFGPSEASFYYELKKARYAFPETSHTIVEDNLTVSAPYLHI